MPLFRLARIPTQNSAKTSFNLPSNGQIESKLLQKCPSQRTSQRAWMKRCGFCVTCKSLTGWSDRAAEHRSTNEFLEHHLGICLGFPFFLRNSTCSFYEARPAGLTRYGAG